ncbi:MAG: FAD-dependent oxidoreductase [Chloroflexi bacterium]|nr:FAD-dependent oxidoreductase [Chloroflexota bacterium]
MEEEKFDVIVVGAGPAGLAAAYILAKSGLNVVVCERGEYPGAKNVMGGVLYRHATERIIPEFWKEAPVERAIVEQKIWMLDTDSAVTLSHKNAQFGVEPYNFFTVLRAKFDRWLGEKVEEAGAFVIPETSVDDVIRKDGRIVGVKTGREDGDLYADVVIAADGVNSLLSKKAGLHPELPPQNVALAVKEVIALPAEKIQDRFNLEDGQGATIELIGEVTAGMMGTGFIYTNKDSLSVGVGAILSDIVKKGISPYDLLEFMKQHPVVRPLLAGGEPKEYLAHLIPEGGFKAIPKLYTDGMVVVGDAAMLVNSYHREGSNLAMTSGRLAAEAILKAKEKNDFSAQGLSLYQQLLEDSYVIKDLKKYKDAPHFFESNPYFLTQYPQMANEVAHLMMTVDGVPKKDRQKAALKAVTSKRSYWQLAKDMYQLWRVMG